MRENWIKNLDTLATTENRQLALKVISAGLDAIDTEQVVLNSIKLENNVLSIGNERFPLNSFKRIKVVGFGKASSTAALALEKILGNKIETGAVIGLEKIACDFIETFAGSHPRPSKKNVEAGKKIYEIAQESEEDDLLIAIVSGGGSALLCSGEKECEQGVQLYDSSLKFGGKITEINTIRKHLSPLKGGGLAKLAYPATVISLIFSDIPGDNFENVASGPTYKDVSTTSDAEKIIKEHNLGYFDLLETPKEDKYFEKVHNFILVSNETAVEAMRRKSLELGLKAKVASTNLYDKTNEALKKIIQAEEENLVVLAAGEPAVEVKNQEGKGGRNTHMSLEAVKMKIIGANSVFISLASDGMDNSASAGAIVDRETLKKAEKLNLHAEDYLENFNSYSFFEQTGDLITTGPTGANVSDLMILLNKR